MSHSAVCRAATEAAAQPTYVCLHTPRAAVWAAAGPDMRTAKVYWHYYSSDLGPTPPTSVSLTRSTSPSSYMTVCLPLVVE